jgi:hypothetical protein
VRGREQLFGVASLLAFKTVPKLKAPVKDAALRLESPLSFFEFAFQVATALLVAMIVLS